MKNRTIRVRDKSIPSIYFFAPINAGFAQEGKPTERLVDFHRQRSGRSIGISYVGNVAVAKEFTTNKNTLYFSDDLGSWQALVDGVRSNGSVAGIQIGCRASPRPATQKWRPKDTRQLVETLKEEFCALTLNEIDYVIEKFAWAAHIAYALGFEVIQLHAAHGYFLSQSLCAEINARPDLYGQDRTLLVTRVVQAVREAVPNAVLDLRLSLRDGIVEDAQEKALRHKQLSQFVELDVDLISLSSGMYEVNREQIYPSTAKGLGVYMEEVASLALQYSTKWWNVAGNIWSLDETSFPVVRPPNLTLSIGRSLIADPEFVEKELAGRSPEVRVCDRNGKCHYYTRGGVSIVCPVSPDLSE